MDSRKPASIRDVAQMAGVSIATVSRVINNNGRFSEATRQRVLEAIKSCGYVTNMAAKSLRSSQSKTIGMIVPDISNDFYSTLALYAEQELARSGYSVFVCNSANNDERERSYIRTLVSKRVDGIICISGSNALSEEAIPQSIPVVCVDRYPGVDSSIPRVISEDERGGLLATEHLIACGCHHILFITSAVEDLNKQNRERGYQRALAQHGIPASDTYRLLLPGHRPSMDEAEQLVKAFLAEGRPLDGIFAVSDHAAVGALAALQAAAVDVPGTVKLVGFDDSIYTRIATPSITSVQRFPQKLAHEGCAALLRLIVGEQAPVETVVPVELVERASTVGAR